jgi:hypothetical protein
MPNHVTTICTVTGPQADVEAFFACHIRPRADKDGQFFDFDSIIPKPPIVAVGLCGCGKEPAPGRQQCTKCREKTNKRALRRAEKNVAAGLCRCGKPLPPGLNYCQRCRDSQAKSSARWRANNHKAGLCLSCKWPALDGKQYCGIHMAYQRRWHARRYATAIRAGKCITCWTRPAIKGHRRCVQCRNRQRAYERARARKLAIKRKRAGTAR